MSSVHIVDTLEALDEVLDRAAAARVRSDDAYREMLASILFQPRHMLGKVPRDPAGDEYRNVQLRLYEQLTQRTYDVGQEETKFDRAHMLRWPFPYVTRSAMTVGNYLMMYGQIIKEMNLPSGAHVLEMGSGYGPLTYQLASMGYRVTCADISRDLLEYVRTRCAGLPGAVETICCDMNDFEATGVYDAVVFFESFHHVLNHTDLIRRIGGCLDDDGILLLAGEPVVPTDSQIVPYPWGLRMDGLSLWAIRRQGWLELGFRLDYFSDLLRRSGWTHKRVTSLSLPGADIWVCRRSRPTVDRGQGRDAEIIHRWRATDAAIRTQCGWCDAATGTIRSQGQAGYLVYGPYQQLEAGTYEIAWEGTTEGDISAAVAEVACQAGQDVLREVAVTKGVGILARTRFHLNAPVADVEFRIRISASDMIALEGMKLCLMAGASLKT